MEEFKVNKTRESRKMTKGTKKQQQIQNPSSDSKANVVIEQTRTTTTTVEETITTKEDNHNNNNNGELEIKCMRKYSILSFYLFLLASFFF
jgi:hypothetical protein